MLWNLGAFVADDPTKGKSFHPFQKILTLNLKMCLTGS